MPSDSSTELEKFCKDHGVHEILSQALALKHLESVDDFAYAFPEIRSLESLLAGLSDSDLSDMGSTDQLIPWSSCGQDPQGPQVRPRSLPAAYRAAPTAYPAA